jgi:hypothetical protein
VEQTRQGHRDPLPVLSACDGLGANLHAGDTPPRNPSGNSLAVGPDHIVQTVNSQVAIFTKNGARFDTSGRLLYGPVPTNTFFAGHGDVCGSRPNGDAVVRYDQLARRWLVVMPIFRRAVRPSGPGQALAPVARPGHAARAGQASDPGAAAKPALPPPPPTTAPGAPPLTDGFYAMCYAIGASDDPLGDYYRYVFDRPLSRLPTTRRDAANFPGQRIAARLATDPKGLLTFRESILANGEAAQTTTLRWEDYTQTAMDPTDDCTVWYAGDYLKAGATSYSTRIGAVQLPGCRAR